MRPEAAPFSPDAVPRGRCHAPSVWAGLGVPSLPGQRLGSRGLVLAAAEVILAWLGAVAEATSALRALQQDLGKLLGARTWFWLSEHDQPGVVGQGLQQAPPCPGPG